jgi:hypothetical protein
LDPFAGTNPEVEKFLNSLWDNDEANQSFFATGLLRDKMTDVQIHRLQGAVTIEAFFRMHGLFPCKYFFHITNCLWYMVYQDL